MGPSRVGKKDASWKSLSEIEGKLLELLGDRINKEEFRKGYAICVIEHKILEGSIEADFSLDPDSRKNDKIGLISYYK